MQPHGLEVVFNTELLKKKKKTKSQVSKFEAMIEIDDNKKRGKLIFPMRSFNKYLLEWLWQMFKGRATDPYTEGESGRRIINTRPKYITASTNTKATNAGIILGSTEQTDYPNANTEVLLGTILAKDTADTSTLKYNTNNFDPTYVSGENNRYGFRITRKIQNLNDLPFGTYVKYLGLKVQDVAATNASNYYVAFDPIPSSYQSLPANSDLNISFEFYIGMERYSDNITTIGGLTKNFLLALRGFLFSGQTARLSLRAIDNSILLASYARSATAGSNSRNVIKLIPTTPTTLQGIAVYYDKDDIQGGVINHDAQIDSSKIITTGLTAGTMQIDQMTIEGNTVSFRVYRDFVNNSSSPIKITRALLIGGRGNNQDILLSHNRTMDYNDSNPLESYITVVSDDTLRVSYKFTTVM